MELGGVYEKKEPLVQKTTIPDPDSNPFSPQIQAPSYDRFSKEFKWEKNLSDMKRNWTNPVITWNENLSIQSNQSVCRVFNV